MRRGIQATVEGDVVHIGKDDLFNEVEGPKLPDSVLAIVETLEAKWTHDDDCSGR